MNAGTVIAAGFVAFLLALTYCETDVSPGELYVIIPTSDTEFVQFQANPLNVALPEAFETFVVVPLMPVPAEPLVKFAVTVAPVFTALPSPS